MAPSPRLDGEVEHRQEDVDQRVGDQGLAQHRHGHRADHLGSDAGGPEHRAIETTAAPSVNSFSRSWCTVPSRIARGADRMNAILAPARGSPQGFIGSPGDWSSANRGGSPNSTAPATPMAIAIAIAIAIATPAAPTGNATGRRGRRATGRR